MKSPRNRVFGIVFGPKVATFFDSWKSEAAMIANSVPARIRGAELGSTKTAIPELAS